MAGNQDHRKDMEMINASEALQYMAAVLNDYEAQNQILRAENAWIRDQAQSTRAKALNDAAARAIRFIDTNVEAYRYNVDKFRAAIITDPEPWS